MKTITCEGKRYTPSKVICVGRNYADHIKEMGGSELPEQPTIFIKPNSAILCEEREVLIPEELGLLHHEVELCFIIGKRGKEIDARDAASYIAGWAVGIDFTLRDVQAEAKKAAGPWSLSKGFDGSAVFGKFTALPKGVDPGALKISLRVGDQVKQEGNTAQMIFTPYQILSFASRFMTILEGDCFMCGTPEGVGAVHDGELVTAQIESLPELSFCVRRR